MEDNSSFSGEDDYEYVYCYEEYDMDSEEYYRCSQNSSIEYTNGNMTDRPHPGVLFQVFYPLAAAIGVFSAIVSLIGLAKALTTPGPTAHYTLLRCLAVAELLFLLFFSTTELLEQTGALNGSGLYELGAFSIWRNYGHILLLMALLLAEWYVVAVSAERWLVICRPSMDRKYNSSAFSVKAAVVIAVICFVVECPRFAETEFRTIKDIKGKGKVVYLDSSLFGDNNSYVKAHRWIVEVGFLAIIPIALLFFFSLSVLLKFRKTLREGQSEDTIIICAPDTNVMRERNATILMLVLALVHLMAGLPYVVFMALCSIKPHDLGFRHLRTIRGVVTLLILAKSTANLLVYCWFSPRFVVALRGLRGGGVRDKEVRNYSMLRMSTSVQTTASLTADDTAEATPR